MVTYSKCAETDHLEFYRRLMELECMQLPGTGVFGSKEFHEDGSTHYHVVIAFPHRVHWADARAKFSVVSECENIHIDGVKHGHSGAPFLKRTQAYVAKDDNPFVFGKWIGVPERGSVFRSGDPEKMLGAKDDDRGATSAPPMSVEEPSVHAVGSGVAVDGGQSGIQGVVFREMKGGELMECRLRVEVDLRRICEG